ncbi:AAA family ATPase [Runella sp. SP2]|uniref:AAA family ATPase n=1 Tax=Runella sp. SP2 TaxID=2268026 RepID=UPI000F094625|nr:AAA family ATPase [Runella sp. SP2]AYQ35810.1 hypothetical protein DTQ70_28170 [Runella sp. SP2]
MTTVSVPNNFNLNGVEEEIKKPKAITGYELLKQDNDEIPFLVENVFQSVGLGAVVGSSDTGKSSFLRQLATSIATKQSDFLGWKINAIYDKAIYVSTEDDARAVSFLLKKQELSGVSEELYKNLQFVFDTENLLETLTSLLEESRVDLIVVDAFSDLFNGQMNANNEVRGFLNKYSQLAQTYECLILFLHHTGKRTEQFEPSKNNVIGSQGFEAKMRILIELRQDFMEKNYRHLCVVKGNYLPSEMKTESFVLHFNENMVFTNTTRRVPYSALAKPETNKGDKQDFEALQALIEQGMTQNKAAEQLGIGKAKASRLMKQFKSVS